MPINLAVRNFASRQIRNSEIVGGVRKITASPTVRRKAKGLLGIAAQFGSSLIRGLGGLFGNLFSWTFTNLWRLITSTVSFAFNFDWNISDANLDKQIKGAFTSLGGLLGGTLGTTAGYLTCGVLPGLTIFAFNEAMGLYVLQEVGEEFAEELSEKLTVLIRAGFTAFRTATFFHLYKNIRNLWRESDDKFKKRLKSSGFQDDQINRSLAERNKPWILSQKIEKRIDQIKSPFWKQFAEEFLDEFGESCVEAGYVVARSLDDYIARERIAQQVTQGNEQTIELEFRPNGTVDVEKVNIPPALPAGGNPTANS